MEYAMRNKRWRSVLMALLAMSLVLLGTGTAQADTTVERFSFEVPIGGPCPAPYEGLAYEGLLNVKIKGSYSSDGSFTEVWKVDGSVTVTAPQAREGETYLMHHRFTVATVNGGIYASGLGFGLFDTEWNPVLVTTGRVDLLTDDFDPHLATCQGIAGA